MSKCLVIDDSRAVREISERIVTAVGLDVQQAADASEAIAICTDWRADVVLLDWDLPSMGALDFLRGVGELSEADRPEIILFATENDPQQFTLAKAAGAKHHILKPFTGEILVEKLGELGFCDPVATQESATS